MAGPSTIVKPTIVSQKSFLKRKSLVLWLTGFTIVYQVIYHIFMTRALQQEAADDECPEAHHIPGTVSGLSPRCMEVQLFKTWVQAPHAEVVGPEVDVAVSKHTSEDDTIQEVVRKLSPASVANATEYSDMQARFQAQKQTLLEHEVKQEEELFAKLQGMNITESQGELASWGHQLVDLRQHLEAHDLPGFIAKLKNSSIKLKQSGESASDRSPNATDAMKSSLAGGAQSHKAWEREFADKALETLRELCSEPHRRGRKDCISALAASEERSAVAAAEESAEWSRNFMREVRQAQREMCQEPHRRGREDCVQLLASIAEAEKGEAMLSSALIGSDGLHATAAMKARLAASARGRTDLEQEAVDEAQQMLRELCSTVPEQDRETCMNILASQSGREQNGTADLVAWSRVFLHEVRAAQEKEVIDEAQQMLRELCSTVPEQDRETCMNVLALQSGREQKGTADLAAWSRVFLHEVRAAQRELCQDPLKRGQADCAHLLASIDRADKRDAESRRSIVAAVAPKHNITAEAAQWDITLLRSHLERANERMRREKELVERYGAPTDTGGRSETPRKFLRGSQRDLHWSTVASWSSPGWLQRSFGSSKGQVIVERKELQASHWGGMIPKVACITAIQSGPQAASRLKYFIDNFRQQTFEGPSQLVLVYNYADTEAADLVRLYADGSYIKAVASRDDGNFPSTTALRFGAWSAQDSQVIVQWDFDTWQHPQRLSLQVRALAYSGRPGCLLKEDTALAKDETLAGESKWMQKHWYPLLDSEHAVVENMKDHQIVQVRMAADTHHKADPFDSIRRSMDDHFSRLADLLSNRKPPHAK